MFIAKTWANEARLDRTLSTINFDQKWVEGSMEGSCTNYIDTTFQEEDRTVTGVIIRDCQGKGLAQWSEIIPPPITVVELETLTASKALQCATDLSLNDVSLEGDSEIIINTLNEDSHSLASFGLPIQDVKCFANLFH